MVICSYGFEGGSCLFLESMIVAKIIAICELEKNVYVCVFKSYQKL